MIEAMTLWNCCSSVRTSAAVAAEASAPLLPPPLPPLAKSARERAAWLASNGPSSSAALLCSKCSHAVVWDSSATRRSATRSLRSSRAVKASRGSEGSAVIGGAGRSAPPPLARRSPPEATDSDASVDGDPSARSARRPMQMALMVLRCSRCAAMTVRCRCASCASWKGDADAAEDDDDEGPEATVCGRRADTAPIDCWITSQQRRITASKTPMHTAADEGAVDEGTLAPSIASSTSRADSAAAADGCCCECEEGEEAASMRSVWGPASPLRSMY